MAHEKSAILRPPSPGDLRNPARENPFPLLEVRRGAAVAGGVVPGVRGLRHHDPDCVAQSATGGLHPVGAGARKFRLLEKGAGILSFRHFFRRPETGDHPSAFRAEADRFLPHEHACGCFYGEESANFGEIHRAPAARNGGPVAAADRLRRIAAVRGVFLACGLRGAGRALPAGGTARF